MREFDVAIVGAGLAGSIAAAMLARAGHAVAVIDAAKTYPDDFRVEKFDGEQMRVLARTGLSDIVLASSTLDRSVWVTRLGFLAEKRLSDQHGFDYGRLVNTLRAAIPPSAAMMHAKVTAIANSPKLQRLTLSTGETIEARLAVLATGLNESLRASLGIGRIELERCQSITFGFDMEPAQAASFPFRALTHYSEHPRFRAAYITLFPIGARMRANFFVYRRLDDPWLRRFRDAPEATLEAVLPSLARFTGPLRIVGPVKMRPVDLCVTEGYVQPGLVLVGDAFGTACPAAGTGARKALVDIERLCNGYVSRWLATPGMDVDKIGAFYADPEKQESDRRSLALARTTRAMAVDPGFFWGLRRWLQLGATRARWTRNLVRAALSGTVGNTPYDAPARPPRQSA
ncbi:MAG: FAD-dependent oxidoreductase [Hyphomicrobium sp.]|uniref:FAD-dependent oxidoreductase n=1 Tax=Hyphomicrobium sp. TaxID=82 RepID=UPI003D1174C9